MVAQGKGKFSATNFLIARFIEEARVHTQEVRKRNERIVRVFWSLIGVGAAVCLIFAVSIFRDTLRIQEAEKEAELRKEQSRID